jgi:TolA-binding protein
VSSAPAEHSPAPSAHSSDGAQPTGKPVDRSPVANGDSFTAAGRAFGAAMTAFREGQFAHAATAFEQFVGEFPDDARGEDASFLRAVAHAKTGDAQGAARLAREYLTRYPHGLRRTEALGLTQATVP